MRKNITKSIIATSAVIMFSSGVFMVGNQTLLASELGKNELVATDYQKVKEDNNNENLNNGTKDNYTVHLDKDFDASKVSDIGLSKEEIEKKAVTFLKEIYHADLNGRYIEMNYLYDIVENPYWQINVYRDINSGEELSEEEMAEKLEYSIASMEPTTGEIDSVTKNSSDFSYGEECTKEELENWKNNSNEQLEVAKKFVEGHEKKVIKSSNLTLVTNRYTMDNESVNDKVEKLLKDTDEEYLTVEQYDEIFRSCKGELVDHEMYFEIEAEDGNIYTVILMANTKEIDSIFVLNEEKTKLQNEKMNEMGIEPGVG